VNDCSWLRFKNLPVRCLPFATSEVTRSGIRKEMLLFALIFSCILLCFVSNVYFFAAKTILRQKGIKTSLFRGRVRDLPDFIEITSNEPDQQKRQGYRQVLVGMLISTFLFLVSAILLLSYA
jgi:hypothetical protein